MKKTMNYITLEFLSRSSNEAFARTAVACFAAQMDPTLGELEDIKTAVSEAVTNAIVHGYPNVLGKVLVKAKICEGNVLEVSVKDRGRGIPPEALSRIMEPFYMVDKSRSRAEDGAGLGLALGQRIAQVHGTSLRYESKVGRGTVVSFVLKEAGK